LARRKITTFETIAPGPIPTGPHDGVDVLAFGAHPDDVEIAMGGTLLAMKARGAKTVVCHLTDGEPTPYGTRKTRLKEADRAAKVLKLDDVCVLPLKNRSLQDTLQGRRLAAEVIRKYRPKIIFAPYWVDAHPDHWNASELVQAARFWAKLTKTDMKFEPWYPSKIYHHLVSHLRVHAAPSFIVDISDHLKEKIDAVRCYESQFIKKPGSHALENIEVQARYYGSLIGREAGEPFFSRETIGVSDPRLFL
jgi:bacillithiol biosynthesis deacetylase BshB1